MSDRYVIRLEVVVHGDLPVDIPMLDVQRAERLHRLEPVRGEVIQKGSPNGLEGRRIAGQAHKDESDLDRQRRGLQPMLAAIQPRKPPPPRHADELATEPI